MNEQNQQSQQRQRPKNIFELINMNIVDMSQDMVIMAEKQNELAAKVEAIYSALYPPTPEPIAPGAEKNKQ